MAIVLGIIGVILDRPRGYAIAGLAVSLLSILLWAGMLAFALFCGD